MAKKGKSKTEVNIRRDTAINRTRRYLRDKGVFEDLFNQLIDNLKDRRAQKDLKEIKKKGGDDIFILFLLMHALWFYERKGKIRYYKVAPRETIKALNTAKQTIKQMAEDFNEAMVTTDVKNDIKVSDKKNDPLRGYRNDLIERTTHGDRNLFTQTDKVETAIEILDTAMRWAWVSSWPRISGPYIVFPEPQKRHRGRRVIDRISEISCVLEKYLISLGISPAWNMIADLINFIPTGTPDVCKEYDADDLRARVNKYFKGQLKGNDEAVKQLLREWKYLYNYFKVEVLGL